MRVCIRMLIRVCVFVCVCVCVCEGDTEKLTSLNIGCSSTLSPKRVRHSSKDREKRVKV